MQFYLIDIILNKADTSILTLFYPGYLFTVPCLNSEEHMGEGDSIITRARPIQLFQADTDIFKIFMPIPITDILPMIFCH